MDPEEGRGQDAGFPGTWFIEIRSPEVRAQPGERVAASCMRLLRTAASTLAARHPGCRLSARITVEEMSADTGSCSVSVIADREVEARLEIPAPWLFQAPETQERVLSRLLSKRPSSETPRGTIGLAEEAPEPSARGLVQFINCASIFEQRERGFSSVPPAVFFMAPALQERGFQVAVDTLVIEPFLEPGLSPGGILAASRERLDRILARRPFCIAFTAMDFYLEELRCLLREIRARDEEVLIALGGPLVTLYPEKAPVYLDEGNVFIRGEADLAFSGVLVCLAGLRAGDSLSEQDVSRLKGHEGLFLRLGNTLYVADLDRRNKIHDLDGVFQETVDLGFMQRQHVAGGFYLHTTRGCPFRCSFCAKVHGSRVRALSSRTIFRVLAAYRQRVDAIQEAEGLTEGERQKAFQVTFSDDDFLLSRQRAQSVFRGISGHPFLLKTVPAGIPSFLSHGTEGRRAFDPELFDAIEAAKPSILSFEIGTDDFSEQEISRLAKGHPRGYTLEDIEEVAGRLEKLGISNRHFVILSNPATRWSDLFEKLITIEQLSWAYPHFYPDPNPFVLAPVGTPVFAELAREGKADTLGRRVLAVPDFPEFTHSIFNMALPRDDLFETDRSSTREFFNRLCDLLKSGYRFSVFEDAYLHFLDGCSNSDPARDRVEEAARILEQLNRIAELRRERILSCIGDASFLSGVGPAKSRRLNLFAHMLSGMVLLAGTLPEVFLTGPCEKRGDELRKKLEGFLVQVDSCLGGGAGPSAGTRAQLEEARLLGKAQAGPYRAGSKALDRIPIAGTFVKTIEERLLVLGLAEEAQAWRGLCAPGSNPIRLDVTADRRDAEFVEDPARIRRIFELLRAADPGSARMEEEIRFIRAESVLRRSIRDDFLGISETRVFLYDGILSLPLGFCRRFQEEFDVSPVLDKDEFISRMLARFLVASELPHSRAVQGTFLFDGLEDLLREMIPQSLADFSRWFLG